jgi:predicted GIY-YIG superfamily endonuclease
MVAIYVLKLARGKYYVGMTRRNIDRVLDHIDGKGAAWTKKYPPSETKPIFSFQEGLRLSDENRITLEMMKKFKVSNVRGGSWCKVRMSMNEIKKVQKEISVIGINKRRKSTTSASLKNSKKVSTCSRCGREGHNRNKCYAKTTIDRVNITTKSWKFRPMKNTKKIINKTTNKKPFTKKGEYSSDFEILNNPFGHPFEVTDEGEIVRDNYGRPVMRKNRRQNK